MTTSLPLRLAAVVLAALVATTAQVGGMVAAFVAMSDSERREPALVLGVGLLLLGFVAGLASDQGALTLQERTAEEVERRVWLRLLALPITFFGQRSMREVIGYANSVAMTRSLLGALGIETALGALTAVVGSVLLCVIDLRLGLVALATALLLLTAALLLSWRQQRHDLVVLQSVDEAHATLYPALTGLEELAAYRAQDSVERAWSGVFRRQKDADLLGLRYADTAESLLLATQTILLAVLCPLAALWAHGLLALGAVTMIALQMAMALGRLTGVLPAVFSVGLARERLAPVLRSSPEQDGTLRRRGPITGRVELRQVGFGYAGAREEILRGLHLVAEPGQMVAVVGPSGAGKSTLLRLVLAQLQPTHGEVLVDGVSTREWDHENLRRQIGYVPQSAALGRGTIRDAVVGVLDDVSDADVYDALGHAGLAELVTSLRMGLDTRVSDGDSGFSGGQEQRLLLARALVRRPRLLLLDEATSALDEQTQEGVARAVAGLGMTRIVVAHRHTTIRAADHVYVLRAGRVVEHGTYDDLAHADGEFASLTRQSALRRVGTRPLAHQPATEGAGR